ncbi:MAG TPA: NAD(P)/FAD-dependent oxidoreductase [Humisphaera sp.]|jgi:monoamine oxidase|nr:NAD(P)/FAD-dependent oxidoreductase [Humisphaera sp.]
MKRPDVIILGAGAAGLAAARALSDAGRSVLILEARNRIGGRIHTVRDSAFGAPVELGAEFIHGRPDVTWNLVHEAKLTAIDLPFDHRHRHAGHLAHMDDISAELAKVMGGLVHLGKRDMSFAEYLRQRHSSPALRDARRFAINFVEGFDAADPERISAKSLAEEQEGIGDVGDETQFRLLDGYGAVIDHLRKSLDPRRVKIVLRTRAAEVIWHRHQVIVKTDHPKSAIFRAARLLITLPVGILQIPPEVSGAIRFSPDIPQKREAASQLGSGPIVKAVLKFREAFWETEKAARAARSDQGLRDAAFMHDPDAAFPTLWTSRPLRLPILTAWAGGPKAVALSGRSKRELQQAAVTSIAKVFGQRPAKLTSMLERFHVYDWAADPFAHGAYSYVTVGGSRARAALAKPIDQTLFFAGEATDTSGQASTVAGALASGQRAARELIARK